MSMEVHQSHILHQQPEPMGVPKVVPYASNPLELFMYHNFGRLQPFVQPDPVDVPPATNILYEDWMPHCRAEPTFKGSWIGD